MVATNIAETSITIPGIRYVVDAGKEKQKRFDAALATSRFEVAWISKASAEQRAGRAGRTGPGHCYRLYSSAVFGRFAAFSKPEILRAPLDQTLLQLKALGVTDVVRFPYVTAPPPAELRSALRELCVLNALELSRTPPSLAEHKALSFLEQSAAHEAASVEDEKR